MQMIHRLNHSQQGAYVKVPFDVPENTAKITITYSYPRHETIAIQDGTAVTEINTVDIALEDCTGELIGASGSNKCSFFVSEWSATPGYLKCSPKAGTWNIILGAYKVAEGSCDVCLTIELEMKHPRWLKGDTHLHSCHSDGAYSPKVIMKSAKRDGLDFIYLTDHNCASQNDELFSDEELTAIPAVEITYFGGHYNLFGVKKPVKSYFANTADEVRLIMQEGRSNGALLSLNHPFCDLCPWTYGFDVPFDMLEVWNGPFTMRNYKTLQFWDSLLKQGKKIPAVGGSDAHRNTPFVLMGAPTMYVYSQSRGASDITAAIAGGHSFIGFTQDSPRIELCCGDAYVGQTSCADKPVTAVVENLSTGDEIAIITDKGVVAGGKCEHSGSKSFSVNAEGHMYARVEVWRTFEGIGRLLAAMSNPIYLSK